MKSVLIIGMGRFGRHMAQKLYDLGHDVLAIDKNEEKINKVAELRVKEEINRGVQMIQYQVITLMTTNGQAPFITVFMYLNEVSDPQTKADLAAIIEEMLHQRIKGVKNEKGVYITPAFPKLIYVLEDDNITEDSKYWNLTVLAAQCSAKRMVPDYISEKVMKELKDEMCIHAWAAVHSSQWTDAHRQRAMWHMPRTLIQTSVNTMDVSTRVLSP